MAKGDPRAVGLFWAVRVQAKDEGYCISHSDACMCSHALYVVFIGSMVPVGASAILLWQGGGGGGVGTRPRQGGGGGWHVMGGGL